MTDRARQGADQIEHLQRHHGRQTERRLVEQHQRRLGHQAATDRQHLLLAAGQRGGQLALSLAQHREEIVDVARGRRASAARPDVDGAEPQVLAHAEAREHHPAFGHEHQPRAHADVGRRVRDVLTAPADSASRDRQHAGKRLHQRRLARAVRTEQRRRASFAHLQRRCRAGCASHRSRRPARRSRARTLAHPLRPEVDREHAGIAADLGRRSVSDPLAVVQDDDTAAQLHQARA